LGSSEIRIEQLFQQPTIGEAGQRVA
jgi:hypothetical protein